MQIRHFVVEEARIEEVLIEEEVKVIKSDQPEPIQILQQKSSSNFAPAGSLSSYRSEWFELTNNNVILNIVKSGYTNQFIGPPSSSNSVSYNPKDPIQRETLRKEINRHVISGPVSIVEKSEDNYVSRVYV